MTAEGTSETWGSYLDLNADVKAFLQIQSTDTSRDYALQLAADAAQTWVSNYCNRPFGPTTYTWYFDGAAGLYSQYIELPYFPVLSIESLIENRSSSGQVELFESTPTNPVDGWQCRYSTGRIIRVNGIWPFPFFPGSRNVQVTWTAGFNPVPADVRLATLELISSWFRRDQQQQAIKPSMSGGTIPTVEPLSHLGISDSVTAKLDSYVLPGMG